MAAQARTGMQTGPAKTILLAERSFEFAGDPSDPYFNVLDGISLDQAPLEAWVRACLPPDAVVIDAGGNIGVTALLLSALLPRGHIHVFEALPHNASLLRENVARNGVVNCTVNAVALGDRAGSIVMAGGGSSSHIALGGTGEPVAGGGIPMITLDDYARTARLDRLDFIKMDVEGFEPAVLQGAAGLIERFRPPVLMEFNSWCLTYVQGFHAKDFAVGVWDAFEVFSLDQGGAERPAGGGSMDRFLHDNAVLHGTIEDVMLRLKPGARVPAKPAKRLDMGEIGMLRAELEAMRRSTSWRVTAPLRAAGRRLRGSG